MTMEDAFSASRPQPHPDPDSAPFWEGVAEGRLLLQQCEACARHRFPPAETCPHCRSAEARWRPAGGRGRVYSWIVVRHPIPAEIFAREVPYIVALVELDEGVRLASNLLGIEPEAVRDGMPVRVVFHESGGRVLHAFRPDGETAAGGTT